MNVAALRRFYAEQMAAAKADNALLSLHLKCTMMKVSDPIMFGHCVSVYFADALEKHAGAIQEIGANVNNGLADVLGKLDQLPAAQEGRDRGRYRCLLRQGSWPGDGRFSGGQDQPARSQRRDRRRIDAGRDPGRRQDVEQRTTRSKTLSP